MLFIVSHELWWRGKYNKHYRLSKGYCRNIKDKYSSVCQTEIQAGVSMKAHFIKFIGCNSEVCQFLNEYQLLNKLHIFIYPYIVNTFCILQPYVQYLQISCCFQILYTNTSYSCISKHAPPLRDLISVFAEYSYVRNMKFCFTHVYMYKTLKIHLDLIHKNASYCFECRASFCMENSMKYVCILSQ
jgi:hypothetical protein